jgi:hypothetical protein
MIPSRERIHPEWVLIAVILATAAACLGYQNSEKPYTSTASASPGDTAGVDTGRVAAALRLFAEAPQFQVLGDSNRRSVQHDFITRALQLWERYRGVAATLSPHDSIIASVGRWQHVGDVYHGDFDLPASAEDPDRSADIALYLIEELLADRNATIQVRHSPPGFHVQYIRWRNRSDRRVIWADAYSDTAITVSAAAYRFRYRDPQTARDTVVDLPCADGCTVPRFR